MSLVPALARLSCCRRPLTLFVVVVSICLAPPWAQAEDAPAEVAVPDRDRDRAFITAVRSSGVTIPDALAYVLAEGATPLEARWVPLDEGEVELRVVARRGEGEARRYERTVWRPEASGHRPQRHTLGIREAVGAAHLGSLLDQATISLAEAASRAARMRDAGRGAPQALISIRTALLGSEVGFAFRSAIDEVVFHGRLSRTGARRALEPPAWFAAWEDAAKRRMGKTLPPLVVPSGRWLNVEGEPPTFEALRGHTVLVFVTDPG